MVSRMDQEEMDRWVAATAATLRAERAAAGISQAQVAERTGIARTSYRFYELGERNPDTVQIAKIAEVFGVTVSYLLGEIERRANAAQALPSEWALAAHHNPDKGVRRDLD